MLNPKNFFSSCGAVAIGCITSLLVVTGGCSTRPSPDASSPSTGGVVAPEPSPSTGGVVAPEPSTKITNTAADSTLAQIKEYQAVPQAFQGIWQADLDQCSSPISETRLEIKPNSIQFYESQGPIQEIVSDGKTTLKVKVELSGEGETWVTDEEFQLSEDQNTLTAISDDSPFPRYRCPSLAKVKEYQEVPQAFQGIWEADLDQCSSQVSETRLEIKPNSLQFYESQGPIQEVMSDGKTILKVKVELSGEGETWVTDKEFQLSEDQNSLTAISDDSPFPRYRCV